MRIATGIPCARPFGHFGQFKHRLPRRFLQLLLRQFALTRPGFDAAGRAVRPVIKRRVFIDRDRCACWQIICCLRRRILCVRFARQNNRRPAANAKSAIMTIAMIALFGEFDSSI